MSTDTNTDSKLAGGYILREGYPSVEDYLHLRKASGLTPKNAEQGARAIQGSWYGCYVVVDEEEGSSVSTSQAVAMGRVIGDGGWYFLIADMAVLPEHQRRGLGDAILKRLMAHIKTHAAPGTAYTTLSAEVAGRGLYAKNGFKETAPKELGMGIVMPDCGPETIDGK